MNKKNKKKIQNQKDLDKIKAIIEESSEALKDSSRNIKNSPFGESLKKILDKYNSFSVGNIEGRENFYLTSILVPVLPSVIIGGVLSKKERNKKLLEAKELAYKEAIAKQTAIQKALIKERIADKERIDYLNGLNAALQAAINDLKNDTTSSELAIVE